jgi:hypothetical protein
MGRAFKFEVWLKAGCETQLSPQAFSPKSMPQALDNFSCSKMSLTFVLGPLPIPSIFIVHTLTET